MTQAAAAPLAPRPTAARLPPWMPLLVVVVAWASQGAVLRNGWVWDDAILVRDGAAVQRGFAAVPDLLVGTWGGGEGIDVGLYRPLVSASLAVQAGIHGTASAFPFHLVNLFLHGGAAVLLLAVLHRLLPARPAVSSSAALLFAAHPLHTGTVSWIVARGDLLAAVFALLAILAWTRRGGTDATAAALAGLLWFLALLSKEMAVTLPALLLGIDAYARGEGLAGALRRRWWAYALLLLPFAAWYLLRAAAVGPLDASSAHAVLGERPWLERLFVGAGALARMAWKVAVPVGLSGDASNDPLLASSRSDLPMAYAAAAAVVLVLLGAAVVRRVRGRGGLPSFAFVAFLVLSLPVLQLVPLGSVFEDRFAYLPSMAFLPLCGLAAERLLASPRRGVALAGCAAVLTALLPACWAVAADWSDEERFDRALLERDPTHLGALDRLGLDLLRQGLEWRRAGWAIPSSDDPRAVALAERSRRSIEEAVRLLERARAVPSERRRAGVLRTLADAYLASADYAQAATTYHGLLEVKRVRVAGRWTPWRRVTDVARVFPADRQAMADVAGNLARAEAGVDPDDRHGLAAQARELAATWAPDDFEAQRLAAVAWLSVDEPARALPRLARAADLAPPSQRAWAERALADARAKAVGRADEAFAKGVAATHRTGGHNEAMGWFEEALRLRPNLIAAHIEIAKILRYKGDIRGALDRLAQARRYLDEERAPADAPERKTIADLVARYEHDRDAPDDGGR